VDRNEWLARCAERLHTQWPRLPRDQLEEVAAEIQRNAERQVKEPEHAAAQWLRLGIPDAQAS
jgi:hypothetical protein